MSPAVFQPFDAIPKAPRARGFGFSGILRFGALT